VKKEEKREKKNPFTPEKGKKSLNGEKEKSAAGSKKERVKRRGGEKPD